MSEYLCCKTCYRMGNALIYASIAAQILPTAEALLVGMETEFGVDHARS